MTRPVLSSITSSHCELFGAVWTDCGVVRADSLPKTDEPEQDHSCNRCQAQSDKSIVNKMSK